MDFNRQARLNSIWDQCSTYHAPSSIIPSVSQFNQLRNAMLSVLAVYTLIHVVLSLAAIVVGIPAITQMLRGTTRTANVFWFFCLTTLTCLTGFGFPISSITPAHVLGVVTLGLLAISYFARSRSLASSRWRLAFLLTAIAAQYLNTFVLVVQSFQKISFLHSLAPTQSELPFIVAQLLTAALFVLPVWKSFVSSKVHSIGRN